MSSVRHWQLIYCSLLFRASENGTLLHPSLLIIFVGKKKSYSFVFANTTKYKNDFFFIVELVNI